MTPGNLLCVWLLAINLAAAVLTVIDKSRAKRGKWRISENTLLLTGLLGGALAMYVTMRCIHHKTRKKKFMLGLPAEILLHAAVGAILYFYNLI